MAVMSPVVAPFLEDAPTLQRCRILCDSFARLLGRPLLPGLPLDDRALGQALYDAVPVIVAHGDEADPLFWFANRTAQRLWELDWQHFTRMPSRRSVAIDEHEDRETLLRRAREMYEEVELGLTRLREAIEAGDLELDGVRGD